MLSVETILSQRASLRQDRQEKRSELALWQRTMESEQHQLAEALLADLGLTRVPVMSDEIIWQAVDYASERQVDAAELLRGVVQAARLCHEYDPATEGILEVAGDLKDPTQLREAGLKILCVEPCDSNYQVLAKSIAVLENLKIRSALTEQERQELALNSFIFYHIHELLELRDRSRPAVKLSVRIIHNPPKWKNLVQ